MKSIFVVLCCRPWDYIHVRGVSIDSQHWRVQGGRVAWLDEERVKIIKGSCFRFSRSGISVVTTVAILRWK